MTEHPGGVPPIRHLPFHDRDELELMCQILATNSLRLDAPAWQRELLAPSPEWVASYIVPLYSGERPGP